MALSDKQSRQALIPSFIYNSSSSIAREKMLYTRPSGCFMPTATIEGVPARKGLVIPSPSEPLGKIKMYSPSFYAACTFGGILSCGLTHHSHLFAFVDQPNSLSVVTLSPLPDSAAVGQESQPDSQPNPWRRRCVAAVGLEKEVESLQD